MANIEGIGIMNYRVLRDVTLGRLWNTPGVAALTPMTAVIGKNGAGKSSLFDAFGFLADCLKLGVEGACDERGRGGFDRIRSQGSDDPIIFAVCYRGEPGEPLITYLLSIDKDGSDRPYVSGETLFQHRGNVSSNNLPLAFLVLGNGDGIAWEGESQGQQIEEGAEAGFDLGAVTSFIQRSTERLESTGNSQATNDDPGSDEIEYIKLQDNRKLGIATLGALKQHPRISSFREFIESWYLSYFTPNAARSLPLAGPQRHV